MISNGELSHWRPFGLKNPNPGHAMPRFTVPTLRTTAILTKSVTKDAKFHQFSSTFQHLEINDTSTLMISYWEYAFHYVSLIDLLLFSNIPFF